MHYCHISDSRKIIIPFTMQLYKHQHLSIRSFTVLHAEQSVSQAKERLGLKFKFKAVNDRFLLTDSIN